MCTFPWCFGICRSTIFSRGEQVSSVEPAFYLVAITAPLAGSGTNREGGEKDADTRRRWRLIDHPRLNIHSLPVHIRPILTSDGHMAAVVIPPSSVIISTVIMSSPTVMVIITEGRRYVCTADHCGQHKPHQYLVHHGSIIPFT